MTNLLHFTKMHGLGNDFVVINTITHPISISSNQISVLANRYLGIGFDQLLLLEPSQHADFYCRIFNADGSEAEQCGNGLRCVARFLHESGVNTAPSLRIETRAGIFPVEIKDYQHIKVTMGLPQIQEELVALRVESTQAEIPVSIISLGNPHAIIRVDSIETHLADELGDAISTHSYFPQGANVGLMQIIDRHHLLLRTFERGVGETNACGSNACAAAVAGIVNGWLANKVQVEFRYGSLSIDWQGGHEPLYMSGPATRVFSGEIVLV
jgi:diaminopimelate epimerase